MLYSRITNFDQAEKALVDATGMKFPCEENWKLDAIANQFKYKLPVELTRLFFRGRTDYQHGQTGFDSIYGSSFTLVLKLLQAYTLELALSTLDEATQREFVAKFQTPEFLKTLDKFKTEEQLAEVFDDILIAANGKELVSLSAPVKESSEYGTDFKGKLAFLKWLINSLNKQVPDAITMKAIKDYSNRLWSLNDAMLIDLLNSLFSLYYKPQGYFSTTYSAQSHIEKNIDTIKRLFPLVLAQLDIPKLFPDLLAQVSASSATADTDPGKLTFQERFTTLISRYDSIIVRYRLTEHFFEYNGERRNLGRTYYNVLERLAYFATGEKKPSEDEAFVSLGLDKNTITLDFFMLKWKLEQQQFAIWLDERESARSGYVSKEQKSCNDEVIQAYLKKFLAFRVLFKDYAFPKEVRHSSSELSKQDFLSMLEMLGIDLKDWPELTSDKINAFYRKAARRIHPDKAVDKLKAADEFSLLKKHQETLLRLKREGIGYDGLPDVQIEKLPEDELTDTHVGLPAEATPRPKTSTLANLSSAGDFFTPEKAELSATRALHIKKAKAYIDQRWLSSWLFQSGYGGIVKFFSPLRYHKIVVTLEYLNNLESKSNDPSSTGHILGLLKPNNLDNLSENCHKVKQSIKEAVKREKMESIESTARTETEYEAKHAQIPLPFFWRFADISGNYYEVDQRVKRKTEDALNHDGIWSQCMD